MFFIDAVKRYSADGMRVACAYAGDTLEDANFTTETADAAILRLYTIIEWAQEVTASLGELREGAPSTFADKVFDASINLFIEQCDADYERMNYRNIIVYWHSFNHAKDSYALTCEAEKQKLHRDLVVKFIKTMAVVMAPIISFTSEFLWRTVLKNARSVFFETYPAKTKVDSTILKANEYIQRTVGTLRVKIGTHNNPPKKVRPFPCYPFCFSPVSPTCSCRNRTRLFSPRSPPACIFAARCPIGNRRRLRS